MRKEKIKKFVKIIAILICMMIVIMSIKSGIMKLDYGHRACCHEEKCSTCILIEYAINFTQNLSYVIQYIVVLLDVMLLIAYILIGMQLKIKTNTLIELKVRLDE